MQRERSLITGPQKMNEECKEPTKVRRERECVFVCERERVCVCKRERKIQTERRERRKRERRES